MKTTTPHTTPINALKWLILVTINLTVATICIYFLLASLADYRPIIAIKTQAIRKSMERDSLYWSTIHNKNRKNICIRCKYK